MARGAPSKPNDLPANLEAEQALLGSLMYDSSAVALLPPTLETRHFSEPFHQRLFSRVMLMHRQGTPLDPVILWGAFARDQAAIDLGGLAYLGRLVEAAPPAANAPGYAKALIEVGTRRTLIQVAREAIERAEDGGEDATQILADVSRELGSMHGAAQGIVLTEANDAMASVLDYVDNPGSHAAGIFTGFAPLDDKLGPWLPGDLGALAGRPGSGKSAEAGIIGMNVATGGGGVLEIHAEMTVQQAWRRRMCAMAFQLYGDRAPAYASVRKRTITYDQRQMLERAKDALADLPLVSVKRTGMTLSQLWALVERQKAAFAKKGIPLVLVTIDHAGLITSGLDHRSRVDEQTAVSNGLKEGSDRHQVATLALLQLNRVVESREDKRPQLHDLRDSGSWEQDCDFVIGTYREAYYAAREKEPETTGAKGGLAWADWKARASSPWIENILLKVREGDVGVAKLWAHMPTNAILGAEPPSSFDEGMLR